MLTLEIKQFFKQQNGFMQEKQKIAISVRQAVVNHRQVQETKGRSAFTGF